MKAIVQDRYGSADVARVDEVADPVVGDGKVLVRIHAASVNIGDIYMMTGTPYIMRLGTGLRRPRGRIRGWDLAGVVERVGSGVTRLRPGDRVFGAASAAFAELAAVPENRLAPTPEGLSDEQAAAVPTAGVTALHGVRDKGRVGPGTRLLVNGAAGGVGTFAVQIGKVLGAEVTGVCSTRNVDLVRSLGADHVIDYTTMDFTAGGERYDVILDNVGNHSLSRLFQVLTPTGTLVPNGGDVDGVLGPLSRMAAGIGRSLFSRRGYRSFVTVPKVHDLVALTPLLESGEVKPVIERTYPLVDTAEALRHVGTGHTRGKVVITLPAIVHDCWRTIGRANLLR